jgi:hypothetical protein
MLTPPDRPKYVVEAVILSQVGPVPAVVHAILAADASDGITQMTHDQLAKAAGISPRTARRTLETLYEAGLWKSESQYRDSRQIANLYQAPSQGGQFGQGGGQFGQAYIDNKDQPSTEDPSADQSSTDSPSSSLPPEEDISNPLPRGLPAATPGVMTPGATNPGEGVGNPGDPEYPRTSTGNPMPADPRQSGQFLALPDLQHMADWLVESFEVPVLAEANQRRKARGRKPYTSVGDHRLNRWFSSAIKLIGSHPLEEVVRVIDWVFTDCGGFIPSSVVDEFGRFAGHSQRLTRLQQIAEFYSSLVDEMAMGSQPPQPPVNYGKPLANEAMEAKATELVSLFGELRTACGERDIPDFRTWGWAKTFRIMLGKYLFDDIKAGIVALRACRDRVDVSRYHDAFHLNQEWQEILGVVDLHKVIQQAALKHTEHENRWERTPPSTSVMSNNEDDSPCDAKDSMCGLLDMADNVEERWAWYVAGQPGLRGIGTTTAEEDDDE